jgi:hypothetical protein
MCREKRRRKGEQWLDPVTPDIRQNISKRCFDGQVSPNGRRRGSPLHNGSWAVRPNQPLVAMQFGASMTISDCEQGFAREVRGLWRWA